MDKKSITFGKTGVEKHKFLQHKTPMSIDDEDINKILVSNKVSFSFHICIFIYVEIRRCTPLIPNSLACVN